MDKRTEIIQGMETSHSAMMAQLDEIDKNRKVYPLWTIREILAHLSGWDDSVVSYLTALKSGDIPPVLAPRGVDVYNEETVSTREGLSYDRIVSEYIQTRARVIELVRSIPEEMVTQESILPWGDKGSLQSIVDIFGGHEMEHVQDIEKLIRESAGS
jgi:hypothetical protein